MKLEEMADVLDGLATALEKCLGKTAVSDFHALSACLRQFAGESVAAGTVAPCLSGRPS